MVVATISAEIEGFCIIGTWPDSMRPSEHKTNRGVFNNDNDGQNDPNSPRHTEISCHVAPEARRALAPCGLDRHPRAISERHDHKLCLPRPSRRPHVPNIQRSDAWSPVGGRGAVLHELEVVLGLACTVTRSDC